VGRSPLSLIDALSATRFGPTQTRAGWCATAVGLHSNAAVSGNVGPHGQPDGHLPRSGLSLCPAHDPFIAALGEDDPRPRWSQPPGRGSTSPGRRRAWPTSTVSVAPLAQVLSPRSASHCGTAHLLNRGSSVPGAGPRPPFGPSPSGASSFRLSGQPEGVPKTGRLTGFWDFDL
jgi:hypothetical protein